MPLCQFRLGHTDLKVFYLLLQASHFSFEVTIILDLAFIKMVEHFGKLQFDRRDNPFTQLVFVKEVDKEFTKCPISIYAEAARANAYIVEDEDKLFKYYHSHPNKD